MLKYTIFILFFCGSFQLQGQLKTDTLNHIYVGKLRYQWKQKYAQYSFQFPCDYYAEYGIISDQTCDPFPHRRKTFHISNLANKDFKAGEGVYLLKDDSLFNAENFYDYEYLSKIEWNGDSDCFPNWETTFKKHGWYKLKDEINKNVWLKFRGYKLVAVVSDYDDQLKVIARFIFISPTL